MEEESINGDGENGEKKRDVAREKKNVSFSTKHQKERQYFKNNRKRKIHKESAVKTWK